MKEQRAREILQSLLHGIDPLSGEELPTGTVLQQADVLRALLAGSTALEESAERASRRSLLPPNVGRGWNEGEHRRLLEAFHAGKPLADIAASHGRSLRAIEARLAKYGLITSAERKTRDRFVGADPQTGEQS